MFSWKVTNIYTTKKKLLVKVHASIPKQNQEICVTPDKNNINFMIAINQKSFDIKHEVSTKRTS